MPDVADDAGEARGVYLRTDIVEDGAGDAAGVAGLVVHGDHAAHGGADECHAFEAEGFAHGFEVGHVVVGVVAAGGPPLGFAPAADVEAVNVEAAGEAGRDTIEGVRLAGEAVDEHDDGRARVPAGDEVVAEAIGLDEDVAHAGNGVGHRGVLPRGMRGILTVAAAVTSPGGEFSHGGAGAGDAGGAWRREGGALATTPAWSWA